MQLKFLWLLNWPYIPVSHKVNTHKHADHHNSNEKFTFPNIFTNTATATDTETGARGYFVSRVFI